MNAEQKEAPASTQAVPQKSKGQIFKEKHGYSRTMYRNMRRAGCSIDEYRKLYKKRRKAVSFEKAKKHSNALAGRKTKTLLKK